MQDISRKKPSWPIHPYVNVISAFTSHPFYFRQHFHTGFPWGQGSAAKASSEAALHSRGEVKVSSGVSCQRAGERKRQTLRRRLPSWGVWIWARRPRASLHTHTNAMQMCMSSSLTHTYNGVLTPPPQWRQRVISHIHVRSQIPHSPSGWQVTGRQRAAVRACSGEKETKPVSITESTATSAIFYGKRQQARATLTVILLALFRASTQLFMSVTSLAWRKYRRETALMTAWNTSSRTL